MGRDWAPLTIGTGCEKIEVSLAKNRDTAQFKMTFEIFGENLTNPNHSEISEYVLTGKIDTSIAYYLPKSMSSKI